MRKVSWKMPSLFRRFNAPFRIVFIDDESLDEVASFRLTKRNVYVVASTLFVVIVTITVSILLFTPLKYYIPGYGSNSTRMQTIKLKQRVDSLSDLVAAQQTYEANINKAIAGKYQVTKDTNTLDMNKVRKEAMNSILPKPEEIKKDAIESVKKENKKSKKSKPNI
ncbi:MAG: hypothetical protein WCG87_07440 [Bacteroidota bacterium]